MWADRYWGRYWGNRYWAATPPVGTQAGGKVLNVGRLMTR